MRDQRAYKPSEAAQLLGIGVSQVRRLIKSGKLGAGDTNFDGILPRYVVWQSDIDKYLAKREKIARRGEFKICKGCGRPKPMRPDTSGIPMPFDRGSIYFLQGGELIKIGFSKQPAYRISTLQLSSPVQLRVLAVIDGTRDDEARLHFQFARLRVHGEWFKSDDELYGFIRGVTGAS